MQNFITLVLMKGFDFQILLLPMLQSLQDGRDHSIENVHAELTKYVELSDGLKMPSSTEFNSLVAEAQMNLLKVGLIESTQADQCRITSFGKMIVSKRLNKLDVDFLRKLPGYKKE